MRIRVSSVEVARLIDALSRAGVREIGGQLFGEQLAPSDFRVTELTIQSRPGSFARFVVDLWQATRDAISFYDRTQHAYTYHNYIGEWHSHPSFEVKPSRTDTLTMYNLVRDYDFKGNFAVLMIVRLDSNIMTSGAWLFDPRGAEQAVLLEFERSQ